MGLRTHPCLRHQLVLLIDERDRCYHACYRAVTSLFVWKRWTPISTLSSGCESKSYQEVIALVQIFRDYSCEIIWQSMWVWLTCVYNICIILDDTERYDTWNFVTECSTEILHTWWEYCIRGHLVFARIPFGHIVRSVCVCVRIKSFSKSIYF